MLKTFFFVPANKSKYIEKAPSIDATYYVYDLEDSISTNEKENALENLRGIQITDNTYVRPNAYYDNGTINSKIITELIKIGFKNFLIPKVCNLEIIKAFNEIIKTSNYNVKSFNFILLIEHPEGLINLVDIIRSKLLNIKFVGLGNYDYSNAMGMKQTLENLSFARNMILNIAKAHNLEAIDIVSLNLNDDDKFIDEVLNGFSMGFDAKFIIHPKQIQILNNIQFYSDEEVREALLVYPGIMDIKNGKVSIKKINGKVYEKPHVKRIINIVNWNNRNESK